jgi:hypothetical protein
MAYKPLAKFLFGGKWPETEATVTAVKGRETAAEAPTKLIDFRYDPSGGKREHGRIEVDLASRLAALEIGTAFPIHYNPKLPADYYL